MLRDFMNLSKALADATRVRLLLALSGGELCACQITELFGLAPSTMSKHLAILYQAQLVNARKEGRWVYYSLPGRHAPAPVRAAIHWARRSLAQDPQVREDARRLKQLIQIDPTELCRKQC